MRAIILIMISSVLFHACAMKKLAVKHADTYLQSKVEKKLPLYSGQKTLLGRDIDKFLTQKKSLAQEVLPLLERIDVENPEKVDEVTDKFLSFYKVLARDFSKILSKYIATLDPSQQKKFFDALNAENKDLLRKKPAEKRKELEKRIEKVIGKLTSGQQRFFNDYETYFSEQIQQRVLRREKMQEKLKNILEGDTSAASKEDQILEAFTHYQEESLRSSRNLEMLKKFLPTLTVKQKEFFRERLKEVKEIIGYYLETTY